MERNKEKDVVIARQIMDISWQAMFIIRKEDFVVLYANQVAKDVFGVQLENVGCYLGFHMMERPCMDCPFMNIKVGEEIVTERCYDSYDVKIQIKANGIKWTDDQTVILCTVLDTDSLMEAKKRAEERSFAQYKEMLRLSGELYQTVVNQLKTIVFEYNCENDEFYCSPLFQERFGISKIQSVDFTKFSETEALIYAEDVDTYKLLFENRDDDFREITCRMCEVNGKVGWYRICVQYIRDQLGNLNRIIGTLKDVDEIVKSHEVIQYRSEYDILTGLYNINRFYASVEHILRGDERTYAIIAFDIDRFKMINDLFGMSTGDDVIKHIADVLKNKITIDGVCCRVHSDMFLICTSYQKKGDIIKLIEKIRKAVFRNDFSFDINTSFGVYLIENREVPINLMCDRATLASRTVKTNAIKFCEFYDEHYRNEMLKTTEIEQDMNVAIADKQFVMYLQPKFSLETGQICGAEVLARWKHPVKGLIQPNDFIPLFEKNGFILRLDEYMWEEACKTLARWKAEGKRTVPLSVNISRYHIRNNDLVGVWKRLLRKYDILPSDLTLEITETFFYDSIELYNVMVKLQDMGFRLEWMILVRDIHL
ncbi:MAG: EAL domain-containing protein [Eubacteriales bacterium]|nr:EAL domain-containing protein [Eubacteriales bacterium]